METISIFYLTPRASKYFNTDKNEVWKSLMSNLGLSEGKNSINLPGFRLERIDENQSLGIGTEYSGGWLSGASLKGEITHFDPENLVCELSLIRDKDNLVTRKYKYQVKTAHNGKTMLQLRLWQYLGGGLFSIFQLLVFLFIGKGLARDAVKKSA